MTPERYRELELGDPDKVRLTREEMLDNWHFCDEFDGLCTQGEDRKEDGSCAHCGFSAKAWMVAQLGEATALLRECSEQMGFDDTELGERVFAWLAREEGK